ncbi:MAG: histidine kinase [Oscillospiraceae bacterium]|nr:histidine kinase [Oscillospiraceae bacterium]
MTGLLELNITFAAFCFIVSVIILVSVQMSEHGKEERSRIFIYIIITNLILLLASKVWFIYNGNPNVSSTLPLIISECIKASCGPVMLILYTRLIIAILKEKTVLSKYIIIAARIAVAVCIADIFSILADPFINSNSLINEYNQLVRPDWFMLSYVFTFVCMAINSVILINKRKYLEKRELLTLVGYILIPAIGVILHMMIAGTPINMISITIAIVFYFAIIQNDIARKAHETDEYNRILYENAPIGLSMFLHDSTFINYNDQMFNMLSIDRQNQRQFDIINDYTPEYQPDGQKSRTKADDYMKHTMDGEKQIFEWTLKSETGEIIPCEVTTVLAKYKGENVGLSYVYDLRHISHLERELVESRISVMMSQIKPHFLYNALTAIVQLCDENPAQAKIAAMDFSAYLRSNMESLNNTNLISIEKEMDHVKHYLSLEKAIYGKGLEIKYIIEAGGFGVPPLTIQPIVENAVKHGIGKKEGGGTITVSISEKDEVYIVTVTDDGAGFDTTEPPKNIAKHIGINNVRKRLELCGGTLDLSSTPGTGTTAVIKLPF